MAIINHMKLHRPPWAKPLFFFFPSTSKAQVLTGHWAHTQASIFRVLVCGEWHWLIGAISLSLFFPPVIGTQQAGGVVGWSKFSMKGLHKSPEWDTLIGEKTVFLHITESYTECRANVLEAAITTGKGKTVTDWGLPACLPACHKARRKKNVWILMVYIKNKIK